MNRALLIEQYLPVLAERVTILGPEHYRIDSEVIPVRVPAMVRTLHQGFSLDFGANNRVHLVDKWQALVQQLAADLYTRVYCGLSPAELDAPAPPIREKEQFMNHLSAANTSTEQPDRNWQLIQTDSEVATKNGLKRHLVAGNYYASAVQLPGQPPMVDFVRQPEKRQLQPAFYQAFSDCYFHTNCEVMNMYWSLQAEGAPQWVTLLTRQLNHYFVPFQLSCANHPSLYQLPECAVLSFDKQDLALVMRLILPLAEQLQPHLKKEVPLFTKPIREGIGLAEDPGTGERHGEYMMKLLAERLLEGYLQPILLTSDKP